MITRAGRPFSDPCHRPVDIAVGAVRARRRFSARQGSADLMQMHEPGEPDRSGQAGNRLNGRAAAPRLVLCRQRSGPARSSRIGQSGQRSPWQRRARSSSVPCIACISRIFTSSASACSREALHLGARAAAADRSRRPHPRGPRQPAPRCPRVVAEAGAPSDSRWECAGAGAGGRRAGRRRRGRAVHAADRP